MAGNDNTNKNSSGASESKPKPCCVCREEKETRDQCLLFNGSDSKSCVEFIEKYKQCMKGYGFDI